MAKRNWIIDIRDYPSEEDFRSAVADELARAEHVGFRYGFGLVAVPVRQRMEDGVVTLGWRFESVTVPMVGGTPAAAGPLPDAPDPVTDDEEDDAPEAERLDGEPEQEPAEPATVGADPYADTE